MEKVLCESKAWIGAGLRNGTAKFYSDKMEFYYGKNLVKSYLIKDIDIIDTKDNGVSTTINFNYDDQKEKIIIDDTKIKEVLKILNKNKDKAESEELEKVTSNEEEKTSNGGINVGLISTIFTVIVILFIGYKLNWFSGIGINSLGISGCYYNESEKDSLCINGKEAYFQSIKDTKYYVTYYTSDLKIEDKYGNTMIISCKRVKDSKNIICDGVELHKK